MVIDIQNSYTVKLSSEFIMKLSLKIPSHLKHFGISVNYTLPKAFSLKTMASCRFFHSVIIGEHIFKKKSRICYKFLKKSALILEIPDFYNTA